MTSDDADRRTEEQNKLVLDINKNSKILSITPEIYLRVIQKAIFQTKEDIKKIEESLPIEDYETIHSISHKLKGDYDNLRITELSTIAKAMNEITKSNPAKEQLLELLNEFIMYFEQLKTTAEQT